MRGGFIGVDIFFVISGFLISTIIFENLDKGTFSFSEFYARRIKRIFPALLLVLIVCYVFGWFALLADEYKQLGKHIAAGAGFVSNFILWGEAGYFDNTAETKPLLHLWSLGIEEQFYIVWPLLLWFAWKQKFNLLTLTISVALVSFILNMKGVKHDLIATFYSPQTRFWELLCGSILAWVILYQKNAFLNLRLHIDVWLAKIIYRDKIENDGSTLSNLLSLVGLALLSYGFWKIDKNFSFPGKWALLPVLGAVLIILAGTKAWINRNILSNKIVVWFGLISFPLYLWHWPLLSFMRIIESEMPNRTTRILVVLTSIMLAWLTYKFIEKPLRFGKNLTLKTISLMILMGIVLLLGIKIWMNDGLPSRAFTLKFQNFTYELDVEKSSDFSRCENDINVTGIDWCRKRTSTIPDAIVIGDSHAEDKFNAISRLDNKRNWMFLGNNSCAPVLGIKVQGYVQDCDQKMPKIISWVAANDDIKTVFITFYGNYFLTTAYAADHIKMNLGPHKVKISSEVYSNLSRDEMFLQGLRNTIELLLKAHKTIIIAIDVPELPFFPKDCLRNSLMTSCSLSKTEVIARQSEHKKMIYRLKEEYPQISIYDPMLLFCDTKNCSPQVNERFLYRDSHHLSIFGGTTYAKDFLEFLSDIEHVVY